MHQAQASTFREKRGYNVDGAAKYLGVSRSLLYRLMAKGLLSHNKLGSRTIITQEELDRLLATTLIVTRR